MTNRYIARKVSTVYSQSKSLSSHHCWCFRQGFFIEEVQFLVVRVLLYWIAAVKVRYSLETETYKHNIMSPFPIEKIRFISWAFMPWYYFKIICKVSTYRPNQLSTYNTKIKIKLSQDLSQEVTILSWAKITHTTRKLFQLLAKPSLAQRIFLSGEDRFYPFSLFRPVLVRWSAGGKFFPVYLDDLRGCYSIARSSILPNWSAHLYKGDSVSHFDFTK